MAIRIDILLVTVLIAVSGHSVRADDLNQTLGLSRRVGFPTVGPELAPFSYGQPIEMARLPDEILISLQVVNEGLTFYAAYRDRNYKAMAAVGAMSLWGGTLRRGIDAVAGANDEDVASVEDLEQLTDREIKILGYLWHTDGRTGHELYRDVRLHGTWKDLSNDLEAMQKRRLIRKTPSGLQNLYQAATTSSYARRARVWES